jgi:hypothetical protein
MPVDGTGVLALVVMAADFSPVVSAMRKFRMNNLLSASSIY